MNATTKQKQASFHTTRKEMDLILLCVKRALKRQPELDRMSLIMDLSATHANGCPMKFDELLTADDFNFFHDIYGIMRHINRRTGEMMDCFLPRFSDTRGTR